EEIVIFGDGQHHSVLKQLLEKELSLPVRLIDPFERVEVTGDAKASKPEFPGTFAPLLGMLLDEAIARPPVIDFLHPRRRPDPPNRRRTYIIAGAAAAAVLLVTVLGVQMRLWSLDRQIGELQRQKASLDKQAKASIKPVKDAGLLDQFAAGD